MGLATRSRARSRIFFVGAALHGPLDHRRDLAARLTASLRVLGGKFSDVHVKLTLVVVGAVVLSTLTVLGLRWAVSRPAPHHAYQATGLGFTRLHKAAPAVALPNLDGTGTVSLTKLSGKPIVLNFWSSTCVPCKKETPALASVYRAVSGKVTFVGIDSVDQHQHAQAFAEQYKVSYPLAFDPQGTAAIHYGVVALPVTVFLSPSGKTILGENIGALTATRLKAILHELYRTA